MHTALWLIPILPFILAFFTTWSLREAVNETVWFNVAYLAGLFLIFVAEKMGYGFFSTSPTGSGGAVALVVGFIALAYRRHRWKKEQRLKAIAKLEEQRRRAAAGQPAQRSLVQDAFRFAATVNKARKDAKR
jgi:hypothetical protein